MIIKSFANACHPTDTVFGLGRVVSRDSVGFGMGFGRTASSGVRETSLGIAEHRGRQLRYMELSSLKLIFCERIFPAILRGVAVGETESWRGRGEGASAPTVCHPPFIGCGTPPAICLIKRYFARVWSLDLRSADGGPVLSVSPREKGVISPRRRSVGTASFRLRGATRLEIANSYHFPASRPPSVRLLPFRHAKAERISPSSVGPVRRTGGNFSLGTNITRNNRYNSPYSPPYCCLLSC